MTSDEVTRKILELPITRQTARELRAGDLLSLRGVIYTARDAAHKRMTEALGRGEELPFDMKDAAIYYAGPCPAKPGFVIGSAGPTTSYRMDAYAPTLISLGQTVMLGKGLRGPEVVDAMIRYGAVYLGATGGAGASDSAVTQWRDGRTHVRWTGYWARQSDDRSGLSHTIDLSICRGRTSVPECCQLFFSWCFLC